MSVKQISCTHHDHVESDRLNMVHQVYEVAKFKIITTKNQKVYKSTFYLIILYHHIIGDLLYLSVIQL